jgi:hypothetical protein
MSKVYIERSKISPAGVELDDHAVGNIRGGLVYV